MLVSGREGEVHRAAQLQSVHVKIVHVADFVTRYCSGADIEAVEGLDRPHPKTTTRLVPGHVNWKRVHLVTGYTRCKKLFECGGHPPNPFIPSFYGPSFRLACFIVTVPGTCALKIVDISLTALSSKTEGSGSPRYISRKTEEYEAEGVF